MCINPCLRRFCNGKNEFNYNSVTVVTVSKNVDNQASVASARGDGFPAVLFDVKYYSPHNCSIIRFSKFFNICFCEKKI